MRGGGGQSVAQRTGWRVYPSRKLSTTPCNSVDSVDIFQGSDLGPMTSPIGSKVEFTALTQATTLNFMYQALPVGVLARGRDLPPGGPAGALPPPLRQYPRPRCARHPRRPLPCGEASRARAIGAPCGAHVRRGARGAGARTCAAAAAAPRGRGASDSASGSESDSSAASEASARRREPCGMAAPAGESLRAQ